MHFARESFSYRPEYKEGEADEKYQMRDAPKPFIDIGQQKMQLYIAF